MSLPGELRRQIHLGEMKNPSTDPIKSLMSPISGNVGERVFTGKGREV
jgi:hypothetical protein